MIMMLTDETIDTNKAPSSQKFKWLIWLPQLNLIQKWEMKEETLTKKKEEIIRWKADKHMEA